jgi:hypothetical protein
MPSRIAARSRGPPRATAIRVKARARSGTAFSRARRSDRAALSSKKAPTVSRRCAIAAASVRGAASRCASSRAPLAGNGADELEIAARRLIDGKRGAGIFARRHRQRRPFAELGALDIGDGGSGGGEFETGEGAERRGRRHAKESREPPLGGGAIEHVAGQRHHRGLGAQQRRQLRVAIQRVGDDDLAGLDARHLGADIGAVAFGDAEFAGRDVDPGEREAVVAGRSAAAHQRQQIIVALGVEQRVFGERARGDQPHHVAPHHALVAALLRLGRIFDLLADRDAVALRDQAMQIFVGAFDRHAAHRNVRPEMLAALGEHDAERAGGDFGVAEEQFIEVAHPVEQQTIRIGGLDLDILLHHRRDASGIVARFGRDASDIVPRFGRDVGAAVARLRRGHACFVSRLRGRLLRCGHDVARGVHVAGTLANIAASCPASRQTSTAKISQRNARITPAFRSHRRTATARSADDS